MATMHNVLILGAGGHAQVVADALLRARDAGQPVNPIGYLDDNIALYRHAFLGLPVLGDIEALNRIPHDAVIIAIGDNQIRKRLADALSAAGETFAIACHPAAIIAPDVLIEPGAMICAGVVVNTGSAVGAHVILNTGCTIDHHNRIDDYVHIAPGVPQGVMSTSVRVSWWASARRSCRNAASGRGPLSAQGLWSPRIFPTRSWRSAALPV